MGMRQAALVGTLPSAQSQARESWPQQGPFLVPGEAGAGAWGEKLQWWPHPLHDTQQWCFTSVVVQVSSTGIPSS